MSITIHQQMIKQKQINAMIHGYVMERICL